MTVKSCTDDDAQIVTNYNDIADRVDEVWNDISDAEFATVYDAQCNIQDNTILVSDEEVVYEGEGYVILSVEDWSDVDSTSFNTDHAQQLATDAVIDAHRQIAIEKLGEADVAQRYNYEMIVFTDN